MAATGHAEPLSYCDACYTEPVPYYDLVSFDGAELHAACAFTAAAEAVEPLLRPYWTPTTLRSAEEGVRVLEQLLVRAKARIAAERTKGVR